jgi:peroxiredoxin
MNNTVPEATFVARQKTEEAPGWIWTNLTRDEIFSRKRVVLFALPGAFTPTCSSTHLPGYETNYDEIRKLGIDEVYCLSVNDTFVMNSWMQAQGIDNVKPIPDGSGEFSRKMGMLVNKDNLGFGMRSWRYSMVVNNREIEKIFVEPGYMDNADDDPFEGSDVYTMLTYLKENV